MRECLQLGRSHLRAESFKLPREAHFRAAKRLQLTLLLQYVLFDILDLLRGQQACVEELLMPREGTFGVRHALRLRAKLLGDLRQL
jgi:hypothetical protein